MLTYPEDIKHTPTANESSWKFCDSSNPKTSLNMIHRQY